MSWINHLPPACWSTFWKSIFKQQLGCRFDIMDSISSLFRILTYAIIYVLIHHIIFWLYLYLLDILYFCTPVQTSSIDVVFVLSIIYLYHVLMSFVCTCTYCMYCTESHIATVTAVAEMCIETAHVWALLTLSLQYQTPHGIVESSMMIFPLNLLKDDDFLKAVREISQNIDIFIF